MGQKPLAAGQNRTVQLNPEKLVASRRARGLSREQLADLADGGHQLSVATIKRAESGAAIYLETARRLAAILGVPTVGELLQNNSSELVADPPPGRKFSGVAVVPFKAIGAALDAQLLADGITEDLTTRLANFWFPIISYGSMVRVRPTYDPGDLASDLDVGYLVEGSVQHEADKVRVRARLTECRSGRSVWTHEWNRTVSDLLILQDELTNWISDRVNQRLLAVEVPGFVDRPPEKLEAWQLLARGSQLFYGCSPAGNASARAFLRRAVERDEHSAHGWYLLALTYQQELVHQWCSDPRGTLRTLIELSSRFRALHPADARSQLVAAYASIYQGNRERAREHVVQAIDSAPNLHSAYALLAQIVAMAGDAEGSFEHLDMAKRLSPCGPDLWLLMIVRALAHLVEDNYAASVAYAEQAIELRPDVSFPWTTMAAAAALGGDITRARQAAERLAVLRTAKADSFSIIASSTEPRILQTYIRGLQMAGVM